MSNFDLALAEECKTHAMQSLQTELDKIFTSSFVAKLNIQQLVQRMSSYDAHSWKYPAIIPLSDFNLLTSNLTYVFDKNYDYIKDDYQKMEHSNPIFIVLVTCQYSVKTVRPRKIYYLPDTLIYRVPIFLITFFRDILFHLCGGCNGKNITELSNRRVMNIMCSAEEVDNIEKSLEEFTRFVEEFQNQNIEHSFSPKYVEVVQEYERLKQENESLHIIQAEILCGMDKDMKEINDLKTRNILLQEKVRIMKEREMIFKNKIAHLKKKAHDERMTERKV